jgi:hypothetical protein
MPSSTEQDVSDQVDDCLSRPDQPTWDFHSTLPVNREKGESVHPPSLFELSTHGEYSSNSNNVPIDQFAPELILFTPIPEASCFDLVGQAIPLKLKQKNWEGKSINLALVLKSTKEIDGVLEGQGELHLSDGKL